MRYHIIKVFNRVKDIYKILRIGLFSKSFIICYRSKFILNWIETDNLCILSGEVNAKTPKELVKTPQNADILYNPYRYPNETQKEYTARIKAGLLR